MVNVNENFLRTDLPVRKVRGKVELYEGSTLLTTLTDEDYLQEIEIQRVAEENKFFGMVITQRLHIKCHDLYEDLGDIFRAGRILKPYIGDGFTGEWVAYPSFTITEVNQDQISLQYQITAYDWLDKLASLTVDKIVISAPYTIMDFCSAVANQFETTVKIENVNNNIFSLSYQQGFNLNGDEAVREVISDIAEATQTIVFINADNQLVFKRMTPDAEYYTIEREYQLELTKQQTNRRLVGIASVTPLGENIVARSTNLEGTIQYCQDNCLYSARTDVAELLEDAVAQLQGFTIQQFDLKWLGMPELELGDRLKIQKRDGTYFFTNLLDETITFDGSIVSKLGYTFTDQETSEANSTNVGESIKNTVARVDKVNQIITLMVHTQEGNTEKLSQIELTQDSISNIVSTHTTELDDLNNKINEVGNSVEQKVTAEDVEIMIKNLKSDGVNSVETTTGYIFDENGLTISKSDSDFSTTITEDGMVIKSHNKDMLIVDDQGVDAYNLTAHKYLRIGKNSRFEDYARIRTGCFYIGGN